MAGACSGGFSLRPLRPSKEGPKRTLKPTKGESVLREWPWPLPQRNGAQSLSDPYPRPHTSTTTRLQCKTRAFRNHSTCSESNIFRPLHCCRASKPPEHCRLDMTNDHLLSNSAKPGTHVCSTAGQQILRRPACVTVCTLHRFRTLLKHGPQHTPGEGGDKILVRSVCPEATVAELCCWG